ncbi:AbrB family transcriptional regulator [Mesobacterium sp. TK19101]|uniref:AbrB family transcriptional regulator n=1 Tax=Mesobacterium hydrothermale TaxID=3111907 RepID=A0ABU6HGU9_9RHOB|nr:AbrB family transcriptional regulator [Mesobacterium sp. TK19101]MEC3860693.1 AbrB family transcriptional regulator [Mesobacterium sp. TK19101]
MGRIIALAVAAVGAAVFVYAGLPLPLLLGPMLACLAAALAGVKMKGMGTLGIFMRTFLGVAVGSSVSPQVVAQMPSYATTLAFVPVFILVIAACGYPLFRYAFGMNHPTAYYGSMPGGLQDMLIFGEEAGGDPRALSLIHATRVLVIVTIAPLLMQWLWNADLSAPPGQRASQIDPVEIGIMIAAGLIGWKVAERIKLFGASILGPMILTAALSLSGVITHRPPAEIIWAAQFFIGISVGVKYVGITGRELRHFVTAGAAYSTVLALISVVFIEAISLLHLAPPIDTFLSFLPGGQGEMVVIAIITGADLAFVVSHHLLRLILVISLAPVMARYFPGQKG